MRVLGCLFWVIFLILWMTQPDASCGCSEPRPDFLPFGYPTLLSERHSCENLYESGDNITPSGTKDPNIIKVRYPGYITVVDVVFNNSVAIEVTYIRKHFGFGEDLITNYLETNSHQHKWTLISSQKSDKQDHREWHRDDGATATFNASDNEGPSLRIHAASTFLKDIALPTFLIISVISFFVLINLAQHHSKRSSR